MKILFAIIITTSLLAAGCDIKPTQNNSNEPIENTNSIQGNAEVNDYFSCIKAGGKGYPDEQSSLSHCDYNGKTYSYDG